MTITFVIFGFKVLAIKFLFLSFSFAEDYEEEILFKEESWKVAVWEFEDGNMSCAAGILEEER